MISNANPPAKSLLPWFACGAILLILAIHLWFAASGHPIYRDQHLGAALEYARHGIDLLHPVIAGFNANGTPTPQEFPLWQAVTGLALRWGGEWWGWGNIVAWLLFASCVPPFFLLARDTLGERAAWWSVLVLALQPLIVLQAGQAGTDGTSLAATVWFLFAAHRLIQTGRPAWIVAAAVFGAIAATQKLPFFMAAGLAAAGLLATGAARTDRTRWLQLVAVGGFAAVAFVLWEVHAETEFERAEYPLVNLSVGRHVVTSGARETATDLAIPASVRDGYGTWYFGTWRQRVSPSAWARGGYRALTGVFGSFALLILAAWAARDRAQSLARWWLVGAAVITLVFTNLVLVHWHYYLLLCPPCALLCGGAIARGEDWVRQHAPAAQAWFFGGAVGALLLASAQGLHTGHFLLRDDYPAAIARIIAAHTTPADRIVIAGGGWGGEELLLSQRRGLSIWTARELEVPGVVPRLRQLGFTKLALLSQSPRAAAIAMVGGSQARRDLWTDLRAPLVASWKLDFESADLCLLEFPASPASADASPR